MSHAQIEQWKSAFGMVRNFVLTIAFGIIGFFSVKTYEKIEKIEEKLNQIELQVNTLEVYNNIQTKKQK